MGEQRVGSVINLIADESASDADKVAVGVGATMIGWTDRTAGTIIEVNRNGREVVFQRDKAIREDSNGMSDAQSYRYERDENGVTTVFTRRDDGSFRIKGGSMRLAIGVRDSYFDYSF